MSKILKIQTDSDRDGQVSPNDYGQSNWIWGNNQPGAIILANNDRDLNEVDSTSSFSELSEIYIEPIPSSALQPNLTIHLHATENASERFTIYKMDQTNKLERVLGKDPNGQKPTISMSSALTITGIKLYIEANQYPDSFFEGLITVELLLLENQKYMVDLEQVVFRVAPWIMTPNTQKPLKVFTVKLTNQNGGIQNDKFLNDLTNACSQANIPLHVIDGAAYASPPQRQDRWIQDEIEFGYSQGASHTIPVVFDSPRDRALDDFPEQELLDEDFGHFQIDGFGVNSLDSFGNLEVSPPIFANGKEYPFGRILFGGKKITDYGADNRQMMPKIRKFLYAQKVQSPIEIFSDWLYVGHIDEFLNFIPDNSPKGFKLMLASPKNCIDILEKAQNDGDGKIKMFVGRERGEEGSRINAEISIDDLLADQDIMKFSKLCQKHIDLNRKILIRELGLEESDIIEAPILFKEYKNRALAYFPDMVNHLVLENYSLVPKPYGPVIDGIDIFEEEMKKSLPTNRQVVFIEDWYAYHEALGEVHCGTNTLRQPFQNKKWWDYMPDGGYNI